MTLSRSIHVAENGLISFFLIYIYILGFPCGSAGKESDCNAGDLDLIPGLGRSPGEGKGYALQYFGLENSMDCIVHGVTKSRAWLSDFHFTSLHLYVYVCALHPLYPFLYQWTFRLFPCLGHCKQCCNEHWDACIFLFFSGYVLRSGDCRVIW